MLGIAGVLKVPIPSGIWLESQGFRLRICFINGLFPCFLVKFLFATLPTSLVADEVSPFFGEILWKLIRRTSRRIPRKVSGWWCFFVSYLARFFFTKTVRSRWTSQNVRSVKFPEKTPKHVLYSIVFVHLSSVICIHLRFQRISCYLVKDVRNKLPIVHRFCLNSWSISIF